MMAKWKSQQMYTVTLTDVLVSAVELTPDYQIPTTKWYWGGEASVRIQNRAITGTIISVTEEVLPWIYQSKDGKLRAALPTQNVASFESETGLTWHDGLSWSTLYSTVKRVYNI